MCLKKEGTVTEAEVEAETCTETTTDSDGNRNRWVDIGVLRIFVALRAF